MFMATARIDALWIHDGLLDARDYKTGRLWHTRVCDVPAAKVQAYVLGRAAQRRGLRMRLRYEYLQPEVDEDPEPWEPDDDDLLAVEEELRARRRADVELRRLAGRQRRGRVPDVSVPVDLSRQRGARRSVVAGPRDDGTLTTRVRDPWIPAPRSSSASARRRNANRPTPRSRRSSCSRTRRARPRPTRAPRCSRAPTSSQSCRSCRGATRTRARCSRAGSASTPRRTAVTTVGGNSPQLLVNEFADRIQRGECDVVLIGGAESMYTRWRARREPRVELHWETGDDEPCSWVIGDDRPGTSDEEMRHGAVAPTLVYPLFETALRAEAGRSDRRAPAARRRALVDVRGGRRRQPARVDAHRVLPRTRSAPCPPDNRMVVFPYAKRMCANIDVDQGAAHPVVLVRGGPRARASPDDRMVFLHAGAEAHDHWFVTERDSLDPFAGARARPSPTRSARRRIGVDDIAHFDLYSCFPSAVQIAMRELGLTDTARPLTVTGGLGFAGGPVNNYPTHAIARMVEVLRADPGSYGLTTALGLVRDEARGRRSGRPGHPTARSGASTRTPRRRRSTRCRAASRPGSVDGDVVVEATSVAFERDGTPASGIVTALPRRRPAGDRGRAATPTCCGRSPRNRGKGGACASRTTASNEVVG